MLPFYTVTTKLCKVSGRSQWAWLTLAILVIIWSNESGSLEEPNESCTPVSATNIKGVKIDHTLYYHTHYYLF